MIFGRNNKLYKLILKWQQADMPPKEIKKSAYRINSRFNKPLPDEEVQSLLNNIL